LRFNFIIMPSGYGKFGSSYFKKNPNSRYGYNVGKKKVGMSFSSANKAYRRNIIARIPKNPLVRYLQPEKKFYDQFGQQQILNTAWLTIKTSGGSGLANPAQGAGQQQRVGIRVQALSIQVKGTIDYVGNPQTLLNNISDHDSVRLVLIVDKQNNQIETNGLIPFLFATINSMRNLDWEKRFKVLKDKIINLRRNPYSQTTGTTNWPPSQFRFNIRHTFKKPMTIEFDNVSTSAYTGVSTNAIYMFVIGNQNSTTVADNPLIDWESRFRYIDA